MNLIGFTGKKLSGKTEASLQLKDFELFNFKDALSREITENFPKLLDEICRAESQLGDSHYTIEKLFEKKPPLMRALMQNYGTDVRRKDDKDYWISRWIKGVHGNTNNIVVDDVRFINEAEAVKALGGIVIRIIRPGQVDIDTHISEMEMSDIKADYEIVNDGTIEDLKEKVNGIQKIQQNTSLK